MSTTAAQTTTPTAGPEPRPLRFFGTTWVDRRAAYWARRALFVLGALVAAAAGAYVMRFGLQGLSVGKGDRLLEVLGTVGVGICTALAAGRTWTRLEKARRERPDHTVVRRSARAADEGAARRRDGQTPLMILGFVGWLLAHAAHGFLEAPGETEARRALERARSKAAARPRKRSKKR